MKRIFGSALLTGTASAAFLLLAITPVTQATTVPPQAKQLVGKVRVSFADLDLSRQEDARILLDRIEKAAYRACGGNPRRHPGYGLMPNRTEEVFEECRQEAIARAILDVDAPVLAQARLQPVGK